MAYVSITGLQLRGPWHAPRFMWHANRAMRQALQADGCLSADARLIAGVHHTRSLWESREAMLRYLRAGAHAQAMRQFQKMATGRVLGFEAEVVPAWDDVHRLWHAQGRAV